MKIFPMLLLSLLLGWSVMIVFAGVEEITQPLQFTGGPEFSVVQTTDTMEFTGQ